MRSAGDPRTPLRLGAAITVLNIGLNIVFIRGLGPIPAFGTQGAAMGTVIASMLVSAVAIWLMFAGKLVVTFPRDDVAAARLRRSSGRCFGSGFRRACRGSR